jgi:hypothetical protein
MSSRTPPSFLGGLGVASLENLLSDVVRRYQTSPQLATDDHAGKSRRSAAASWDPSMATPGRPWGFRWRPRGGYLRTPGPIGKQPREGPRNGSEKPLQPTSLGGLFRCSRPVIPKEGGHPFRGKAAGLSRSEATLVFSLSQSLSLRSIEPWSFAWTPLSE